jgi:hypothetical protein
MNMIIRGLPVAGIPARSIVALAAVVAIGRHKNIVLKHLALALVAAGLAFLISPMSYAAELPKPRPFAEIIPAHAGQCLTVDEMKPLFDQVIAEAGGRALVLTAGVQQRFADKWRHEVELEPVTISVTFVSLTSAAHVAEFDNKGCLLTMTSMSIEEFLGVVHAHVGETVAPMRAPSLLSNGRTSI